MLKKTWSSINGILKPHRKSESIRSLIVNGEVITETQQIVEIINDYFSSIGIDIANAVGDSGVSFQSYLSGNYKNSMFFTPTTNTEIKNIISSLKNNSSTYNFSASILKYNLIF